MDYKYLLIAVAVMCGASILPRMLPFVFGKFKFKSRFIKSFLYYMPYAVLAALTFPSVFYSTDSIITASIGTGLAILLSVFIKEKFYIVALVCVLVVFGLGYIL